MRPQNVLSKVALAISESDRQTRHYPLAVGEDNQLSESDRQTRHYPLAVGEGNQLSESNRQTRSGVMGSCRRRTPVASAIALAMAGAVQLTVISPTPLAPKGPWRS